VGINIEPISVARAFGGEKIFFASGGLYRESGGFRVGLSKKE